MKRSFVLSAAAVLVACITLTACETGSEVSRQGQPLVLTGSDVSDLVGTAPGRIVAFRATIDDGTVRWAQIPVQVDQRKVVPFGVHPTTNATPGVDGTVYGNGTGGPTALQYADPTTFVGADPDPNLDADDEIALMVDDAGAKVPAGTADPARVIAGSGVEVQVTEPGTAKTGAAYLFRSDGTLDPAAGKDYVDYRFRLNTGDYKSTYKRADGPNPESSEVVTPTYRARFTDRWLETDWTISAGGANGADILDGHKNQFFIDNCGRSNLTFADSEGAFIANIDGPVRAIRSYVGANSGPLTQRTHVLYRDQEVVITDLRVHTVPGIMDFLDFSPAAQGMTYRSSTLPGGVTIDGALDSVPTGVAQWESVSGSPGSVVTTSRYQSDTPLTVSWFQRDQASPPEAQCWGDGSFLGAAGPSVTNWIPNTDPRTTPFNSVRARRTNHFLPPVGDGAVLNAISAELARHEDIPVTTEVRPFN